MAAPAPAAQKIPKVETPSGFAPSLSKMRVIDPAQAALRVFKGRRLVGISDTSLTVIDETWPVNGLEVQVSEQSSFVFYCTNPGMAGMSGAPTRRDAPGKVR